MISLYLDTSSKYLCIGIAKDYKVIYKYQELALQKQSELTIPELKKALDNVNLTLNDVSEVCVTIGPGSFTGIRIAMCVSKVLASMNKIPLKAISSLNAYANQGKKIVVLDAKAKRAYYGIYDNNKPLVAENVAEIETLKELFASYKDFDICLDAHLFDMESEAIDVIENMNRIAQETESVSNVDALVPVYLKDR